VRESNNKKIEDQNAQVFGHPIMRGHGKIAWIQEERRSVHAGSRNEPVTKQLLLPEKSLGGSREYMEIKTSKELRGDIRIGSSLAKKNQREGRKRIWCRNKKRSPVG